MACRAHARAPTAFGIPDAGCFQERTPLLNLEHVYVATFDSSNVPGAGLAGRIHPCSACQRRRASPAFIQGALLQRRFGTRKLEREQPVRRVEGHSMPERSGDRHVSISLTVCHVVAGWCQT